MKKITLLFAALMVISCASRKVKKTETSIDFQAEVMKKDTIARVTTKDETEIDTSYFYTHELTPIDSTKEFIVDGKVFKNVKIKTSKIQKGITTHKIEKDSLNTSNIETGKVKQIIEQEVKDTERTSTFPWWIVIAIIIFGGALLYKELKKNG